MQLGYTIPLQRHLKIKPPPHGAPCGLAFCWELHVLPLGGRPSLIAAHASSRYTFLLCDLSQADWMALPETFAAQLRFCLEQEGFTQGQVDHYFTLAGQPEITKTHGRRPVAFLNRAVDDLQRLPVTVDTTTQSQPQINHFLNQVICHAAGYQEYGTGRGFLQRDFAALGIERPGNPVL